MREENLHYESSMSDNLGLRIGIIGTGRIANRFIPEAEFVEGVSVPAVYNPHAESAARFADKWGIDAYAELEAFYDSVEAVYIASPHGTHYEYIKSALEQGKHVLCEKPMVLQKAQAKEVFRYAEENKLVLFEGIKTAHCPGFVRLLEVAQSGIIGEIRNVEACFTKLVEPDSRELTDYNVGGSLTELGSYCLLPVIKLFGEEYSEVRFDTINNDAGIDIFTKVSFQYQKGGVIHSGCTAGLATVTCGLGVKSEGCLLVCGTKGYIIAEAPWWKTTHFEVHYEDPAKVDRYDEEYAGDGLRYELRDFVNAIQECSGFEGENIRDCARRLTYQESAAIAGIMELFMCRCHS